MKKQILIFVTAICLFISAVSKAQTAAWSQTYETVGSRIPENTAKADYDDYGNLYVAGHSYLDSSNTVTIYKISSETGAILDSETYTTSEDVVSVYSVKVFRNPFGANYVYVFLQRQSTGYYYPGSSSGSSYGGGGGSSYTPFPGGISISTPAGSFSPGSSYGSGSIPGPGGSTPGSSTPSGPTLINISSLCLLKIDTDLNLLNTLEIPNANGPEALEIDPVNGNAVIQYNSGVNTRSITRCTASLSIAWTRSIISTSVRFKFCPSNDWIAVVSYNGLQRISSSNTVAWTVNTISSATSLDVNPAGEIFLTTGTTLKKYSGNGVLGFSSSIGTTAPTFALTKATAYGEAFLVFGQSTGNIILRRYNYTGISLWSVNVAPSGSFTVNGLEEIDGNTFISGAKSMYLDLFSIPGPFSTVVDSSYVYKYNISGGLLYNDAFSTSTGPLNTMNGIYCSGMTKYKSQITVFGRQSDETLIGIASTSWYLRRYGPMARFAAPETNYFHLNEYLEVYPNPAIDKLYINSGTAISKLSIYNLGGNLIKEIEQDILTESSFDVSTLPPGTYLLSAKSEAQEYNIKFIKQ